MVRNTFSDYGDQKYFFRLCWSEILFSDCGGLVRDTFFGLWWWWSGGRGERREVTQPDSLSAYLGLLLILPPGHWLQLIKTGKPYWTPNYAILYQTITCNIIPAFQIYFISNWIPPQWVLMSWHNKPKYVSQIIQDIIGLGLSSWQDWASWESFGEDHQTSGPSIFSLMWRHGRTTTEQVDTQEW